MQRTIYTYPQLGSSQNSIDLGPSGSSGFSGSPPGPPSHFQSHYDPAATLNKKRRIDRACDACRRRKTKCDGPKMPDNICSNCLQTKKPCTYIEDSKPRGPTKAHVTGLEDRMEKLEALLKQLRPETDFTSVLGPPVIRGSWKHEDSFSAFQDYQYSPPTSSRPRRNSHPTPARSSTIPEQHLNGNVNSNLTRLPHFGRSTHLIFDCQPTHRACSKPDRAQSGEDVSDDESSSSDHSTSSHTLEIENVTGLVKKLKLRGTEDDTEIPPENNNRFHGKSSAVGLVEATRQFKLMHLLETLESARPSRDSPQGIEDLPLGSLTRRPEFWRTPRWERVWESLKIESSELFSSVLAEFPPADLAQDLINLYFVHLNTHIPLLHRPTFERQWSENLHHKNIWFAAVCTSLFAVASRFTDDPRVIDGNGEPGSGPPNWGLAGWAYFEVAIGIHRARRSLFYPASLFEIQTFTLLGMFIRGTESPSAAWILVSIGIRKAQDVGAHRQNVYRNKPSVDEELWKRAIWCLIIYDRIGGAMLGRGCGVGEEDFDIDLPLEVDDEYWETEDPSVAFQQPPGLPSKVGAFILFIKLSQIVAFALKTVYALDKSRIFGGFPHTNWRKDILNQLSTAMSDWKALIPKHLVWSPEMGHSEFISQAATLQTFYHFTEMLIYRPFMSSLLAPPPPSDISPLNQAPTPDPPFPATDICIGAARSCARIVEVQIERGISLVVPIMIHAAHVSAAILLIRVWDLKAQEKVHQAHGLEDIKPPFIQRIEPLLTDISVFIHLLEWAEPRWRFISTLLPQLKECIPVASYDTGAPEDHTQNSTTLPSRGTSNELHSPEHFPLARRTSQGRSSPMFQSEDRSWQWESPVAEYPIVQHTQPGVHDPMEHALPRTGTAPYLRGIDPPISLKQEPSPPLRPSSQGQYHNHDSYPQDPGSWPSSSQHMRSSHQRGRTNSTSVLPRFNGSADRSAQISYNSNVTRRTSFPSYIGDYAPDHEDQCRAGSCDRVPGNEGGGVTKQCNNTNMHNDINMHYDNPNTRQSIYSYPRPTEARTAPVHTPTVFDDRTYRAIDPEGPTWGSQEPRSPSPPERAPNVPWSRPNHPPPHTQQPRRNPYPQDSRFTPNYYV